MTQDEFNKLTRDDLEQLKFVLDSNGDVAIRVLGGASGVSAFLALSDTPSSFAGQGLQTVRVNAAEDALEFSAAGSGDVAGPGSSVDDRIATFDSTTGKIIQDGGSTIADVLNRANHTGEEQTADIADNAITNAKLAQVSGRKIIGKTTTGVGDVDNYSVSIDLAIISASDDEVATTKAIKAWSASGAETLTNKSIDLTDNTLSGTKAEFDAACSDGDFVFEGDTIPVADGGTGSTTASAARTALGLEIGSDVQAYNANILTVQNNLNASVAPVAGDDTGDGYAVGSVWIDTTADKAYICLDASSGAAVWTETTQSGGGGGTPALPLLSLMGSDVNSDIITSFVEKDDYVYTARNSTTLQRYKKQGGQLILDNNTSTNSFFDTLSISLRGLASIDSSDDYIYFTTPNSGELRRYDIGAGTDSAMTVSGGGFGTLYNICSDGTFLYLINNSTTMRKYSVSGTTATFVETITLPFAGEASTGDGYGPLVYNGSLFYFADSRLVKCDIDGTADYDILTSASNADDKGFTQNGAFFEWNGYVMYVYARHDSEDFVGFELQVIESPA